MAGMMDAKRQQQQRVRTATTTYDPSWNQQVSFDAGGMMPFFMPPAIESATTGGGGMGMRPPLNAQDNSQVLNSAGIRKNRQRRAIYGRYMSAPNSLGGGYVRLNQFEPGATVVGYEEG